MVVPIVVVALPVGRGQRDVLRPSASSVLRAVDEKHKTCLTLKERENEKREIVSALSPVSCVPRFDRVHPAPERT